MQIFAFILAGIGWLLAAIFFEVGYKALTANNKIQLQKGKACQIWWIFMGIFSGIAGPVAFLVNVPLIFAIGASHVDLASRKHDIITVREILQNIPAALRGFAAKVKPFLK